MRLKIKNYLSRDTNINHFHDKKIIIRPLEWSYYPHDKQINNKQMMLK